MIWHELVRILAHHPHLIAWFRDHRDDGFSVHYFVHTVHHYPRVMHRNLASRHYCHWLWRFLVTRDGVPGIDLLLGA